MAKVIRKVFPVFEYEREEKWLNEMAEKGFILQHVGFFSYHFEECIPGEYQVRMQLLEKSIHSQESKEYISFSKIRESSIWEICLAGHISERKEILSYIPIPLPEFVRSTPF